MAFLLAPCSISTHPQLLPPLPSLEMQQTLRLSSPSGFQLRGASGSSLRNTAALRGTPRRLSRPAAAVHVVASSKQGTVAIFGATGGTGTPRDHPTWRRLASLAGEPRQYAPRTELLTHAVRTQEPSASIRRSHVATLSRLSFATPLV